MLLRRLTLLCFILGCVSALGANTPGPLHQDEQPPEVVEAYRVCKTFERLLGENLDFDRAYEATFPKDRARRRAIAIADGEFGDQDFASIDDELLIKAYKLRMQIFYLMLPLAGPSGEEEALFFPPDIKEVLQREAPHNTQEFRAYVYQLERDVLRFRSHLERLSTRYPFVKERLSKFKSGALATRFEPPVGYKIEPRHGYYRTGVLGKDETYFEIDGYSVATEQGKMRIVGIRFFNRLF